MVLCPSFTSSLGVGYLMVSTSNYPNVLAFCFLDELQKEFIVTYDRKRISSALRPYSFIEFGEFLSGQRPVMGLFKVITVFSGL